MLKEITQKETNPEVLDEEDFEHKVIVFNDDVNTFDFVIDCLMNICKHDELQAEQLTLLIHYKGKATVKTGSFNEMKLICEALLEKGLSAELF